MMSKKKPLPQTGRGATKGKPKAPAKKAPKKKPGGIMARPEAMAALKAAIAAAKPRKQKTAAQLARQRGTTITMDPVVPRIVQGSIGPIDGAKMLARMAQAGMTPEIPESMSAPYSGVGPALMVAAEPKPVKPADPPEQLNEKQVRFVSEYMVDMNAAQAAIRSGYSSKTARQIGYRLLTHVHVQAAIDAKRKELAVRSGITRQRVIDEMAKIAFSDLRLLFNENGTLKAPKDWPDGAAGAVSSLEVVEMEGGAAIGGSGVEHIPMYTNKLKLWDKGKQLEGLLKHLGMEGDEKPPQAASMSTPLEVVEAKLAKLQLTAAGGD